MNERIKELCQTITQEKEIMETADKQIQKQVFQRVREKDRLQRQEEYEKKLKEAVEELTRLIVSREWTESKEKVEAIIDSVEDVAFMEGYIYAIAVLEEGLVNME